MPTCKDLFVLFPAFLCLLSFGCKKEWLEAKSDVTQAVPSTLVDFQALLDLPLRMNDDAISLGEIAADGHYITEDMWNASTQSNSRNAYTWSNQFAYSLVLSWNSTYQRVFANNVVLDGLLKVKPSTAADQLTYDDIKGQALFNRAEAFWNIAQVYSLPYDASTLNQNMGIPLRLNSDISEKSVRSTVKQTYDAILTDTRQAAALLPVQAVAPTRGSKAAAYALLARTYLSMSQYDSAGFYARKSLESKSDLLDYNSIPATAATIIGDNKFNPEVIFFCTMKMDQLDSYLTNRYLIDPELYLKYHENDLRRSRFFKVAGNGNITFKGNYDLSATPLFCGLTTDEMYLISAESYARDSNTVAALSDLNTLLMKRWDNNFPYEPITALSAMEALVIILEERRKELILRGLRWTDLRRLNQETRFQTTLARNIGGKTYTLEPGSFRYTFPLPDNVINQSTMPQTTGW